MTVKEMLLSCNIEQTAALHFAIQEPPKCEDWNQFLQAHRDFIQEITDITPISGGYVILGTHFRSGGKLHFNIHMYCKNDLPESFTRHEAWEENRSLKSYSDADIAQLVPGDLAHSVPEHYDMEQMPWEELLGVEIFEKNLHSFGKDYLAAFVIREMSFWGLSQECSRKGQRGVKNELDKAMQEIELNQYASFDVISAEIKETENTVEGEMPQWKDMPSGTIAIKFPKFSTECKARAAIAEHRELLRYISHNKYKAHPMLLVCAGVEGVGKTSACGILREDYSNIMETTLSPTDVEKIRKARQEGFYIQLIYLGLNTLEEHLQRIQNRVEKGGESADITKVNQQFQSRFTSLAAALPLCHEVVFYDCTNGFYQIAEYQYGQLIMNTDDWSCPWFKDWMRSNPHEMMVVACSDLPPLAHIRITNVVSNNDFSLTLAFYNGEHRRLDMKPYLKYGTSLEKIMRIEDFRRVYLSEDHVVCWDIDPNVDSKQVWENTIDLDPEWCYIMGVPCVLPSE